MVEKQQPRREAATPPPDERRGYRPAGPEVDLTTVQPPREGTAVRKPEKKDT